MCVSVYMYIISLNLVIIFFAPNEMKMRVRRNISYKLLMQNEIHNNDDQYSNEKVSIFRAFICCSMQMNLYYCMHALNEYFNNERKVLSVKAIKTLIYVKEIKNCYSHYNRKLLHTFLLCNTNIVSYKIYRKKSK